MAAAIPSTEPSVIPAGDTVVWTTSLADYLPSSWTISYAFRLEDGSALLNVTGAASGTDYALTIPASSSTTMTPGTWLWQSYVTMGAERYSIASGVTTVTPNFANVNYSADLRSSAKIAYDHAIAAWNTFAVSKSVTLNGRTYTARDTSDLVLYVDRCRADYQRELDALQMAKTGVNPRHIFARLKRV